jgi:AcrR family transcriptional regulator
MREAADAAPGPLSALAACISTFAARALNDRRLTWAVLAEPVDADIDALRVEFRRAIAGELAWRINVAISGQHLSDLNARAAAPAIVGALLEGLIGPLASPGSNVREAVQAVTLLSLRALGVVDAHAKGLVAQCVLPENASATLEPAPSSTRAARA